MPVPPQKLLLIGCSVLLAALLVGILIAYGLHNAFFEALLVRLR